MCVFLAPLQREGKESFGCVFLLVPLQSEEKESFGALGSWEIEFQFGVFIWCLAYAPKISYTLPFSLYKVCTYVCT